ncbi:MAG: glycosyltransferase family 4 protein [Planctomycetota bacterium]
MPLPAADPRPLAILFVTHSFPPAGRPELNEGGMQRVAQELHRALKQREEVRLHTFALRTSWKMTHVRMPVFLLRALRQIPKLVRRHEIDVVLFSSMVTASLSVRLNERVPAHLATICHGQDVTLPVGVYQRFVPKVFDALDLVMPVSQATGEACIERGCVPEKVEVVPNGIRPGRFDAPPSDRRAALAAGFPDLASKLSPEDLLLVSVGRQVERKGFHWFAEHVMPQLPERVHYWMAGDGPMAEPIDDAIQATGLSHRVRRLGRVTNEQLQALYTGADLFVMPNIPVPGDMEGFGVVLLEAGLNGLPSVAARLEGIRDVITDGENGYFVESGNTNDFVRRITPYLDDRAALGRFRTRARQHVLDTFTWPAIAGRTVDLLNRRFNKSPI